MNGLNGKGTGRLTRMILIWLPATVFRHQLAETR